MFKFKSRKTGKEVTLLNPAEKAEKAIVELKTGLAITNNGEVKLDKKGKPKKLTAKQRAWRHGYMTARKDNAKAFKAKQTKK